MAFALEPVTLESNCGDEEGMLALRDGRLFAVLVKLSEIHQEHTGRWFVEAVFTPAVTAGDLFQSLPEFIAHASECRFER